MDIRGVNSTDSLKFTKIPEGKREDVQKPEEEKLNLKDSYKKAPIQGEKDETKTIYDRKTVLELKKQVEQNKLKLIEIISKSISKQGFKVQLLQGEEVLELDEEAKLELEELISEDGELGIEKTSDRIVDFAIAISGGDKSKASILKDAIEKGFKEAEKALGGKLPEISLKTYEKI